MNRGFKIVTPDNWLQPDPLSGSIVRMDRRDGTVHPVDGRDWIRYVHAVPLADRVPQKVLDAFDFVGGAVGYGYFYYPLFTIVVQQILRVADFAVVHLFTVRADLPKPPKKTFEGRLIVLKDAGYVNEAAFTRWTAIRNLRNSATHPEWQQTLGHAALEHVRIISEMISALPWPEDSTAAPGMDG